MLGCGGKIIQYFTQQRVRVEHRPGRLRGSGHDSRRDTVTSWTPPCPLFTQHWSADRIHCCWSFHYVPFLDVINRSGVTGEPQNITMNYCRVRLFIQHALKTTQTSTWEGQQWRKCGLNLMIQCTFACIIDHKNENYFSYWQCCK